MNITKKQDRKIEIQKVASDRKNQHIRDWVVSLSPFYNLNTLLENIKQEATENKGKVERLSVNFHNNIIKTDFALGLSTHTPIAETVREEYRILLIEMIRDIEREYDCKTATEKCLAEAIASSHVRAIQFSRELTLQTQNKELSHEKNGYCSMLGKEIDRANRNFSTALITLKQIKNPQMEINVKTKNAFIGQNQQFNNNQNKNND